MDNKRDILIATDFFPKIGGAHYWLYQVYRNWPERIVAYVQDYANDRRLTDLQAQFDKGDHGALELRRLDFSLQKANFLHLQNLLKVWKIGRLLTTDAAKRLKKLTFPNEESQGIRSHFSKSKMETDSNISCLHVLRVIPDGYFALFAKILASKGTKLIFYAHGEEFSVANTSREFRFFTKMALKKADLIIANSHFTKRQVREFFAETRVEVVHLGVNYRDFQIPASKALAYRRKWMFPEDATVLLTVARMEPRKNHARVLQVLTELLKEGLSLGYVIIGTGEEEERLKALARDLGIADKVRFLGRVSEEEKILAFNAADIYVMPSIQLGPMTEGFGIVFLEAAAAGIPSIAGNVGGQPEAVLHGQTGLIVDGTKEKELYKAVRYLVLQPEVREEMGRRARRWARQHDWKNISCKIYEAVSSICHMI